MFPFVHEDEIYSFSYNLYVTKYKKLSRNLGTYHVGVSH